MYTKKILLLTAAFLLSVCSTQATLWCLRNKNSSIIQAVKNRNHTLLPTLLTKKNINTKDKKGLTPLHWAAAKGYNDIICLLLQYKANLHAKSDSGRTPLHIAVFNGQIDTIPLLVSYGANVQVRSNTGNTPLHLAISRRNSSIVQLLLQYHANIEATNKIGNTPLHLAVYWTHPYILTLLCNHSLQQHLSSIAPLIHHFYIKHPPSQQWPCELNLLVLRYLGNPLYNITNEDSKTSLQVAYTHAEHFKNNGHKYKKCQHIINLLHQAQQSKRLPLQQPPSSMILTFTSLAASALLKYN